MMMMKNLSRGLSSGRKPVQVTVTGAAGAIGYALLFRVASGALLGADTPVHLRLLEIPQGMDALKGVEMELHDCAFPLLDGITTTSDQDEAFEGSDFAFLVGAKPRSKGMERADLLQGNAAIFSAQGKAISRAANRDTFRAIVVGNPANTNAMIAARNCDNIAPERFSAMTRLDHNRGLAQLSAKLGCHVDEIDQFAIWGNHSATQFPDIQFGSLHGAPLSDKVDQAWYEKTFIPDVQQRGAAIIAARGASSAASAASAAIDHMRDWARGLTDAKGAHPWTSMAVWTGEGSEGPYGTAPGIFYSFPVTCKDGDYHVVEGLEVSAFARDRMDATNQELVEEMNAVSHLL